MNFRVTMLGSLSKSRALSPVFAMLIIIVITTIIISSLSVYTQLMLKKVSKSSSVSEGITQNLYRYYLYTDAPREPQVYVEG